MRVLLGKGDRSFQAGTLDAHPVIDGEKPLDHAAFLPLPLAGLGSSGPARKYWHPYGLKPVQRLVLIPQIRQEWSVAE